MMHGHTNIKDLFNSRRQLLTKSKVRISNLIIHINFLKICHYTVLPISGYQSGAGLSDIGCPEVASNLFYWANRSGINLVSVVRKGTDPAPETWCVSIYYYYYYYYYNNTRDDG